MQKHALVNWKQLEARHGSLSSSTGHALGKGLELQQHACDRGLPRPTPPAWHCASHKPAPLLPPRLPACAGVAERDRAPSQSGLSARSWAPTSVPKRLRAHTEHPHCLLYSHGNFCGSGVRSKHHMRKTEITTKALVTASAVIAIRA